MKCAKSQLIMALTLGLVASGCSRSSDAPSAASSKSPPAAAVEQGHGAGPNGGVIFDFGSYHAEFTVDHEKQECYVLIVGADEKSPQPVAATDFILSTKKTKTAEGVVVPPLTVVMSAIDAVDGKAAKFVGSDPGIANVADFAGVLSGEIDGKPAMGEFSEAAGGASGHTHSHTPHDGVVAALNDGAGFVELKLHDDKGDLELWLAKDRGITQPLDISVNSTIQVAFKDVRGKTATLAVRNDQRNEDEDGQANLRDGLTNYFIFPGDSGQDPTWLMGKEFRSAVRVSFSANGNIYTSEEFVLVPHTHADGQGHAH